MSAKKNPRSLIAQEGNLVIFKDLGIYSDNPEEDKKINGALSRFLKSIGHPPAKIRLEK